MIPSPEAVEAAARAIATKHEECVGKAPCCTQCRCVKDAAAALTAAAPLMGPRWQKIEGKPDPTKAPWDGKPIWALIHSDLSIRFQLERLAAWNGRQIPLRHEGKTPSDYDLGWSVAAPLGYGGIPDSWVAGWMPLPPPPESGP